MTLTHRECPYCENYVKDIDSHIENCSVYLVGIVRGKWD